MTTAEPSTGIDRSVTTITPWVPVGLEKILRRAADIANARGHGYLGQEVVTLALLQEPHTFLARNWPSGGVATIAELHDVLIACLRPADPRARAKTEPDEPVRVSTTRSGPHAAEIRGLFADED